jgi:stage II sporulation protein D (peptidoglycan lytic transglycosylase)
VVPARARRRVRGRRAPGGLAAALLLAWAAPASGEELIRVLSGSPARVVELPLEAYVAGVVSGEMPASFPPEAQKAQAVAARSYALTRKIEAQAAGRDHDIGAGVLAQVWAERPSPAARAAAEATAGEVLVVGMEPVEAYFHAACGGRTEDGLAALGRDLPYLAAVECGRCEKAPGVRWKLELSARDLAAAAGLKGRASAARVSARTPTGRAERVDVEAGAARASLAAAELRQRLGWSRLPSLAFDVRPAGAGFVFAGRGQGHGAGLCQWGAAGFAREGKGYREILAHYYPGTDVVKMY